MRITILFMTVFLMHVSANTAAQITLKENHASMQDVLKSISKQSGYDFIYSDQDLKLASPINIELSDASLDRALQECFTNQPLEYAIADNTVMIKKKERALNAVLPTSRALEYIQQNQVQGKVTAIVGGQVIPLSGVSVMNKETKKSTQTDEGGSFVIEVAEDGTLVFSSLGFEKHEVKVNGRKDLSIILDEQTTELSNVVVTGYQNIDRKFFTGSAAMVKAKDAERVGVPDVSRMLEGQVAGVSVQNVSGTFGAAPKIRVRGATSISGDNKPLWVVDGIILEDVVNVSNDQLSTGDPNTLIGSSVAGLNPDDIESFQILKDAAATAMYGARAMNGVIVVTTKKGTSTAGAPRLSYTSNLTSFLKPSYDTYNVMNSADQMDLYLELRDKGYVNPARTGVASSTGVFGKMYNNMYEYDVNTSKYSLKNDPQEIESYLRNAALRNTDWFDVLFKNSIMQEHSLSVSSGNEKSRMYASTSFLQDHGWTVADRVKRMTGNVRGDFNLSEKVQLGLLATASVRDQASPGTSGRITNVVSGQYERDFDINPFNFALNTSRALAAYEDDGSYAYYTKNYTPFNILHELEENALNTSGLDFKMQGEFKWSILNNLKYSFDGAYRYVKTKQEHNISEYSNHAESYRMGTEYGPGGKNSVIAEKNKYLYTNPDDPMAHPISVLPYGGFHNTSENNLSSYYVRNSLNWTNTYNRHSFDMLGLTELRFIDRQKSFFEGVGYQFDRGGVPYFDPVYFEYISKGNSSYYGMSPEKERYVAFMLRGAYSFDDRYSANFTMRYDGSNQLGTSLVARWLPTWNISGAWNIDHEDFFENQSVFDQARVRATYGLVASMGPATNSSVVYNNTLTNRPNFNDRENALEIGDLENSELTWEKQYEANLGLDLGFLDNKLVFTTDFYSRRGFDLIGLFRNSGIGGQSNKYANYADMKSHGMEYTIQYSLIDQKDWKWSSRINMAYHKSEITKLQNLPRIWDVVRQEGGAKEGYPVRSLFSIQFENLNPLNGLPLFLDEAGNSGQTAVYMQSSNLSNLIFHGPVDPTLTGGFYNSVSYKSFSINALMTFSSGNTVRLAPVFSRSYSDQDASSRDLLDRWVIIGDDQLTQSPSILGIGDSEDIEGYPYNNYNYSDVRVAKGDFIRLKQLMLTYQLPKQLMSSLRINTASVSLVGNNLWLLYSDDKLGGQDPEFYQSGGVALPIQRQFSLSLKVGF